MTEASASDTMVKSDAEWVDLSNQQLEIEATVGGVKKKLSGVTNGPDIHAPIEPIPDNDWTGETWGLFWPDQEMEEKSEDPTKYIKVIYNVGHTSHHIITLVHEANNELSYCLKSCE